MIGKLSEFSGTMLSFDKMIRWLPSHCDNLAVMNLGTAMIGHGKPERLENGVDVIVE